MQINGHINALLFHPAAFGVYLETAPPLETKERDVLLGTLDTFVDLLGDKGVDVSNIHKSRSAMTSMAGANYFRSDLMRIARILRQAPNRPYFEATALMMEKERMVFGLHQKEDAARMRTMTERPGWKMSIQWFCQFLKTTQLESFLKVADATIWGDMADHFALAGLDGKATKYYIEEGLQFQRGARILFVTGQEAAKEKYWDYAKMVMNGALVLLARASLAFERGGQPERREKITALQAKIHNRLDWVEASPRQGNPGEPRWSFEAMASIARAAREEI